ncbi:MAG: hypothetical protein QXH05_05555 [Thermosphaera sp.]
MKILPRNNVKAVLLHETLTELIVAFNILEIVRALVKHFRRKTSVLDWRQGTFCVRWDF